MQIGDSFTGGFLTPKVERIFRTCMERRVVLASKREGLSSRAVRQARRDIRNTPTEALLRIPPDTDPRSTSTNGARFVLREARKSLLNLLRGKS